ncbi:MAG: hypothetical protein AAF436_15345 [Myxococcota bacterium]
MTLPRRVLPGTTYLVTRRCTGRRFLLRPDRELNRAFLYCLALATEKYGIEVHALCVMSNHYHLVLTDPRGVLPLFTAWLNRQLAMCVKRLRDWDEVVWEPNVPVSAVELTSVEEVLDKVAYTLLNPVSAGLVRTPNQWPGAISLLRGLQRRKVVARRPRVWFANGAPETVRLRWVTPRGFSGVHTYHGALQALIDSRLRILHKESRRYLGRLVVLRASFASRPARRKTRFGASPTFSALTRERWRESVKRLRAFRAAYRSAYLAWRDGQEDVEFPLGTWWVARYTSAIVAT